RRSGQQGGPAWNTSGVPWQTLYFKGNLAKLQQVKATWDPGNVFHHKLSVTGGANGTGTHSGLTCTFIHSTRHCQWAAVASGVWGAKTRRSRQDGHRGGWARP
uniref:BBE domain-containing protein n=1 Tax=Streptomyces sp. Agncl-13 TaxID=3400628 RepID=UPI003A8944C0